MFIFRMLDFVFRLIATVMMVLMLQISVGGRTLEDYLMSFIQTSDSMAPIRDIAYSSVRRVNPNVQISEKRTPASVLAPGATSSSGATSAAVAGKKPFQFNLKTDLVGELLNTFFSQYKNILQNATKDIEGAVGNRNTNLEQALEGEASSAEASETSEK